jgi:hypothetical protein
MSNVFSTKLNPSGSGLTYCRCNNLAGFFQFLLRLAQRNARIEPRDHRTIRGTHGPQ